MIALLAMAATAGAITSAAEDRHGDGGDIVASSVRIATEVCPRVLRDREVLNDRVAVARYGLFPAPPDFEAGIRGSARGAEVAMGQFDGGDITVVGGSSCQVMLEGERLVQAFDAVAGRLQADGAKVTERRTVQGMRWIGMATSRHRITAWVNPTANAGAIVFAPR